MVKATTPQKQMQAFREEALRVKGPLEARKLVERIETVHLRVLRWDGERGTGIRHG